MLHVRRDAPREVRQLRTMKRRAAFRSVRCGKKQREARAPSVGGVRVWMYKKRMAGLMSLTKGGFLRFGWLLVPRSGGDFLLPHLRNPAPPVVLGPPKHRGWARYAHQRRADVRFVRLLDLQSQKAPGQGTGAERQRRGRPARTHDESGPRQRHAPRPGPSIGGSGWKRMVQLDRGVDRRQVGCSSSSSPSGEFQTSTQHEGAPRVPMRLARGTSRPASIVARQATSRVAVTAQQGCQHLSTGSQAVVFQRLLLTFCYITCIELYHEIFTIWT